MHLTDIRIDEIVNVNGLPCYARGWATFTNGRRYHFDANFAHGYAEARIFLWRPTDGRAMDPTTRTARAIHNRLGFTEFEKRERDAIAAFEYERVTACQEPMRPDTSCPSPEGRPIRPCTEPIETFATSEADPMKITRDFRPLSDRYSFDCGPCSYANGFAQIDTRQDGAHFGYWCSPAARILIDQDPGPGDRIDAYLLLTGQEFLWRGDGPCRSRPRRRPSASSSGGARSAATRSLSGSPAAFSAGSRVPPGAAAGPPVTGAPTTGSSSRSARRMRFSAANRQGRSRMPSAA